MHALIKEIFFVRWLRDATSARLCFRLIVAAAGVLAASAASPPEIAPGVFVVGSIQHRELNESSGLAASRRYPGIFWTHNDSGNPLFVFAINEQGEHLGAFEVQGAGLIDWEALAIDDSGFLYFADIGADGLARSHGAVHKVAEPNPHDRWGPARVLQTWLIRFPGEREDCEAFFVHNHFGYVLGKQSVNGTVSMHRFSLSDSSPSITLEFVARIPSPDSVADIALSDDAARLAMLSDRGVTMMFVDGNPARAAQAPRRSSRRESSLMEGVAFAPDGVLVTSETDPSILLFANPFLLGAPVATNSLSTQSGVNGGSVEFFFGAEGYPAPSYEWRFNGALIPGQNSARLAVRNLTLEDAGVYEATAANPAGSVRSSAQLTVVPRKADVRITEVMSSQAPGAVLVADWWEMTNFDDGAIDLSGWRFNDGTGGLFDAFRLPEGLMIEPGETIVFVEDLTAGQFRAWWGESQFEPDAKIVSYAGSELSFASTGDSLRVWDAAATDDLDIAARADFGSAEAGVSFGYDRATGQFGQPSRAGVNGAFKAAAATDVGSPGRIGPAEANRPRLVARVTEGRLRIEFEGETGRVYVLEGRSDLGRWAWERRSESAQAGSGGILFFDVILGEGSNYFRVRAE